MCEIRLHPEAVRGFRRLHGVMRDRIETAIDALVARIAHRREVYRR